MGFYCVCNVGLLQSLPVCLGGGFIVGTFEEECEKGKQKKRVPFIGSAVPAVGCWLRAAFVCPSDCAMIVKGYHCI